jgi:hypothetical protein
MKKISLALLFCSLGLVSSAQYKKASFFSKSGRTYGAGAVILNMKDGVGSHPGFYISSGSEGEGLVFFSGDFTFVPAYTFTYTTRGTNNLTGDKVTFPITVKTKPIINVGYNMGVFLIKDKEETRKIKPYVTIGFNIVLLGGVKDAGNYGDLYYDVEMPPQPDPSLTFGGRGGIGILYNIKENIGIKLDAGYSPQVNVGLEGSADGYNVFKSHSYIGLGVRFKFLDDN